MKSFGREAYIAPAVSALGLAIALGGTACGGHKKSSEQPCESQPHVSPNFPGDQNAVQDNQKTWHEGVQIDTEVPADATYLDIAYTDPGGNWHGEQVPSEDASRIKMKIGHISVSFRTRLLGYEGSLACKDEPITTFTEKPYDKIKNATAPDPHGYQPEQP
jgi:hypothetical protein